jgi:hypothetical protein
LNIAITEAQFHPDENGRRHFDFVFDAPDRATVNRVTQIIRNVTGVTDVTTRHIGNT